MAEFLNYSGFKTAYLTNFSSENFTKWARVLAANDSNLHLLELSHASATSFGRN